MYAELATAILCACFSNQGRSSVFFGGWLRSKFYILSRGTYLTHNVRLRDGNVYKEEFHRRIQGGPKGAETPLNFFRYVF